MKLLRAEQLEAHPAVVDAYASSTRALVAVIAELARQCEVLQGQVKAGLGRHPDAEIHRSQPGLGDVLGARVLAEYGDDPDRYAGARARKNHSGMAPVTARRARRVPATPATVAWPTRSTSRPSPR